MTQICSEGGRCRQYAPNVGRIEGAGSCTVRYCSCRSAGFQISSHTAFYPIQEMWAGLRPVTPDGLPVIGRSEIEGLLYATGHYRNGILLAPITASIIGTLVQGRTPDLPLEPFSPLRFSTPGRKTLPQE